MPPCLTFESKINNDPVLILIILPSTDQLQNK